MFAKDYWKSKELYKSISDAIPEFENLQIGQSISINDDNGNLSYKVMTKPLRTTEEIIDDTVSGITIGKPSSTMTMVSRELVRGGLGFMASLLKHALKSIDIDLDADQRHDFDLYLQDMKTGENHWFRANHKQGKLESLLSMQVDFDKDGNVVKEKGLSDRDPYQMLQSEEFKNNFTSLRQNIKG